jgi:hypothetical protein
MYPINIKEVIPMNTPEPMTRAEALKQELAYIYDAVKLARQLQAFESEITLSSQYVMVWKELKALEGQA